MKLRPSLLKTKQHYWQNYRQSKLSTTKQEKFCEEMVEALDTMTKKMKGQEQALKAKDKKISALKVMDPSDTSNGEVEKTSQRTTHIITSLGAMGQEIYKKRKVLATLTLVGGNITMTMMQYGVNITNLDAQHFKNTSQ